MNETLRLFATTESLEAACRRLLKKLEIKYFSMLEGVPFNEYFRQNDFLYQYVLEAQQHIINLWQIGYIDDANFDESLNTDRNYASMLIFACEINPDSNFTRKHAVDITRALNRCCTKTVNEEVTELPVIVIFRQGTLLSIATCERNVRKDGAGEKVGKVSMLRNVDCENLHAGHRQILQGIADNVRDAKNFNELNDKWLLSFSNDILSDHFFKGYKAIYEDIIALTTGKRMRKENKKWVERTDNEIPQEEKAQYGSRVMAAFANFEDPEKAVRDYVKKLMGRLVFIQFLQKKGWMGVPKDKNWGEGDKEFIQNLFRRTDKKDTFVDDVLEPLFRDINTYRAGYLVTSPEVLGNEIKVPYLNGGLFEEDDYDRAKFSIPAKYFWNENADILHSPDRELGLLQFFSKYNFTIDENAPDDVEVGIDPEMLGRIFEDQLEDNREKGAFYTPKEIVHYMCRESLIAYLTTYSIQHGNKNPQDKVESAIRELVLSPEKIVSRLKSEKPEAFNQFGDALRNVKICDPAIGSGAFPIGMLNELVRCRIAIDAWAKDKEGNVLKDDIAALKCEIVNNNIYGVDIERGAIDIARLRFWLSVVVDEKTPQTLPNLDYKFMQGNSLITTFNGEYVNLDTKNQKHQKVDEMKKVEDLLHKLKLEYYSATGDRKHELSIKIKDAILQLISLQIGYESWKWFEKNVDRQLSIFPDTENSRQMTFADIKPDLPEEIQRVCELGAELRKKLNDNSIPLIERSEIDIKFFDWRMMFTEVFEGKNPGFDIVIGNPPYIRIQTLNDSYPSLVPIYKRQYQNITYGNFDISILFTWLGYNLLNYTGILTFIQSNKFLNGNSGKKIRELFHASKSLKKLIDFGTNQVFENATTYTCILFLSRNQNKFFEYKKFDLGENIWTLSKVKFRKFDYLGILPSDNWVFTYGNTNALIDKIFKIGESFKNITSKIFKGSSTGNDKIFLLNVVKDFENEVLVTSEQKSTPFKIEKSICRHFLFGESVLRYSIPQTSVLLLFPYKKENNKYNLISISDLKKDYPNAYSYLMEHKNILLNRKIKLNNDNFFKYSAARSLSEYEQPKILIPDMLINNRIGFDPKGHFFTGPAIHCPIFTTNIDQRYYLGILNSSLFWYFISKTSTALRGDAYRLTPEFLNPFAFPKGNIKIISKIIENVQLIFESKKEHERKKLEKEIDHIVYELYGLTNGEVKLIDPNEQTTGSDEELFKA